MPYPIRPALVAALVATPLAAQEPVAQGPKNVPAFAPAFVGQTRAPESGSGIKIALMPVAAELEHPWGMALLPDGSLLVTERPGRMRVVAADGSLSEPVAGLPEVWAKSQGGLLDVAVGPDFAEDRTIFWTYAKPMGDGLSSTAAARGRLSEDMTEVTEVADIFVQQPPSPTAMHYGSRIVFDPDGLAYVTTGEHSKEAERGKAQDIGTGYGKVIRLRADGSTPPDNPFAGELGALESVWSYGHRNVQGAAIDASGQLWTVEHGPKGGDELNRLDAGGNYGWPVISYGENYNGSAVGEARTAAEGMEQPVYYWDPVIAPAGMAFYDGPLFEGWQGNLLIASLKPGGINRLVLAEDAAAGMPRVVGEERLFPDVGRVRDVEVAPDGALLLLTDEAEGRLLRAVPAPPEG